MKIDIATMVIGAVVSGVFSSLLTVVAIKVDIRWMKRALDKLEKRADRLEEHVFQQ